MLSDPLAIASSYITAADIPAIGRDVNGSSYRLTVGSVTFLVTIKHTTNKGRRRSIVRLDASTVATNPFDASTSVEDTTSTYLVIDRSERLVTDATVVSYVKELIGVLDGAAAANVTTSRIAQIVGGES